jgi:hypothetical protein
LVAMARMFSMTWSDVNSTRLVFPKKFSWRSAQCLAGLGNADRDDVPALSPSVRSV